MRRTSYTSFYVYDLVGTWTNSTDTFTFNGVTYTVTAQTAGPYGYVRSYVGTSLKVILGTGSAAFAGSDTFRDVPKLNTGTRTTATVSSVTTALTAFYSWRLLFLTFHGETRVSKENFVKIHESPLVMLIPLFLFNPYYLKHQAKPTTESSSYHHQ